MSDKGIELSPKHGLNPTIPHCFWCGEPKNEIALMGRIRSHKGARDDIEAPHGMVLNYEPCDKCQEQMNMGVCCMEVQEYPVQDGQPPFQHNPDVYLTGRWCVITVDGADQIFPQYAPWEVGKKVCVDRDVFNHLTQGAKSSDTQEQ